MKLTLKPIVTVSLDIDALVKGQKIPLYGNTKEVSTLSQLRLMFDEAYSYIAKCLED